MLKEVAISIPEAQRTLGIGRTKLYELLRSGELPAKKLNRRTIILKSDLDAFLVNLPDYSDKGGK